MAVSVYENSIQWKQTEMKWKQKYGERSEEESQCIEKKTKRNWKNKAKNISMAWHEIIEINREMAEKAKVYQENNMKKKKQ